MGQTITKIDESPGTGTVLNNPTGAGMGGNPRVKTKITTKMTPAANAPANPQNESELGDEIEFDIFFEANVTGAEMDTAGASQVSGYVPGAQGATNPPTSLGTNTALGSQGTYPNFYTGLEARVIVKFHLQGGKIKHKSTVVQEERAKDDRPLKPTVIATTENSPDGQGDKTIQIWTQHVVYRLPDQSTPDEVRYRTVSCGLLIFTDPAPSGNNNALTVTLYYLTDQEFNGYEIDSNGNVTSTYQKDFWDGSHADENPLRWHKHPDNTNETTPYLRTGRFEATIFEVETSQNGQTTINRK